MIDRPALALLALVSFALTLPGVSPLEAHAPGPTESSPAPLVYEHRPTEIDSGWEFGLEDDAAPGRPPEQWKPISLPHNWKTEKVPNDRSVYGWYRFRFRLKLPPPHALAIMPGMLDSVDETYLNGRKIGGRGSFRPRVEAFDEIRVYYLPPEQLRIARAGDRDEGARARENEAANEILIRVSNLARGGTGGIKTSMYYLGPLQNLEKRIFFDDLPRIGFSLLAFVVAGYFFLFYLRRRQDTENFYYAVVCLNLGLYFMMRLQLRFDTGLDFMLGKRFEYFLFFCLPPSGFTFLFKILNLGRYKIVKLLWQGVLLLSILPLLVVAISADYYDWTAARNWIAQPLMGLIVMPVSLIATIVRAIRGMKTAQVILFGLLLLALTVFNDTLVNRAVYEGPYLLMYGFGAMILCVAALLSGRFVRLHNRVAELNASLEQKVEARTAELKSALGKITKLKNSQDGDYFLTSLLLQPLQVDRNTSETVETEYYTSQYKKFRFRRREGELGGDLTVIGDVLLGGRKYVAFVNGDAMGKSMQGAGGALILGVMFHAALERSREDPASRFLSPERWLLNVYRDFQRVFVTFEGSMYVSVTMGLVDEVTGFLYYFNAEHPRPVLYRDGRTSFLDGPRNLRKLGTPGGEEAFHIDTFALQPGDVLITGSDGRDDLEMEDPAGGQDTPDQSRRVINEDETLFGRLVQRAEGRLEELAAMIQSTGRPIDDISLIRIAYRPGETRFEHHNAGELIKRAHELESKKEFERAAECFGEANMIQPEDLAGIYRQAACYFSAGRFAEAAATLERILLRAPDEIAPLLLAAETDLKLGDPAAARARFFRARGLDPGSEEVRRLAAREEFSGSAE